MISWNDVTYSLFLILNFQHSNLTQDTLKVPKYYFCGDRFYQVLHTRLRTECISLNQHLHKRNLVGNPYCICGEVESNTHYLLTCPRYTHMRDEMVTSISQITNLTITTDVLLFGNDEVSDEVNTAIFKAVQKFIKTSKRFNYKLIIQRFSFLDIGKTQNKSVYFHSAIVYEFISSFYVSNLK